MCGCERCQPGTPDPTYTEAYRLECLARSVLSRPLADQRPFLDLFERKNGPDMALKLKEEIWRVWDAQRRQSPGEQDQGFDSCNVTDKESTKMSSNYRTLAAGMGGGA